MGRSNASRSRALTLLHFPALLVGIFTAVFLLTASVASYGLFIAASENAFVEEEIRKGTVTRYGAGVTYSETGVAFTAQAKGGELLYDARREALRREAERSGLLAAPLESIRGPEVELRPSGDRNVELLRFGRLMFRNGFVENVDVVESVEAPGVWISDYTATGMDVSSGDEISISARGRSVQVRVRGIYEALHRDAPIGYWRPWRSSIYPPCPGPPGTTGCLPPPPFVLADRELLISLAQQLGIHKATHGLDAPIAPGTLTLDEARLLSAQFDSLLTRMSSGTGGLRNVFRCCGRQLPARRGFSISDLSSSIDQVVAVAERRVGEVRLPMTLLVVAATAVCILALAGIAAYSLYARRTEMGFRAARGETPGEFASRILAETIGPMALGGVGGYVIGAFLSTTLSGGVVSSAQLLQAALESLAAVAIAAVVLTVVATARFARLPIEERRDQPSWIAAGIVIVLVVAAAVSAISLLAGMQARERGASEPPDMGLIAFPLLTLIVLGAASAFGIARGVVFARARLPVTGPAFYVALSRVAGASRLAFGLFAAALVCFGLFIAGQVIRTSLEETITAKTRLFVGSDLSATVDPGDSPPDGFSATTTEVVRVHHAGLVGRTEVDLVGIDPTTFARVAYWDDRFGAPALGPLVERLNAEEGMPAIVASGPLAERTVIDLDEEVLAIEAVANVEAFPGMVSERPLVVVSTERLQRELDRQGSNLLGTARASTEWWIRGDPDETRVALNALDDPPYSITTAKGVQNISYIATVLDSFAVLQILGAAAGVLVVAALLTYLQARHRARLVSSILSRRMGLRKRAASLAVGLEVGILVGLPYLFAIPAAIGIAAVVAPTLDPLAVIPPELLFEVPATTVVLGAVVVGMTLLFGSIWLARSAERANPSDVFRVAE